MNIFQIIVLGIVQGLTEFIPVSSSAHLVLIPYFFGWNLPPVFFGIVLHLGTLTAILIYFWKDILQLLTSDRRYVFLIIVACIPTAVMGFLFKDFFESLFENPLGVSVLLLVTGSLLWVSDTHSHPPLGGVEHCSTVGTLPYRVGTRIRVTVFDALWIGFAQGCAIAPGISRSGATISTGLLRRMDGETAVRFSFLLSIPAILGALVFKLKDFHFQSSPDIIGATTYWLGGIVAGVSGYLAIKVVFKSIKTGKFKLFAYYCWALGLVGILSVCLH